MATFKIKDANGNWIIPEDPTAIKYTKNQALTETQKRVARNNIGALAADAVTIYEAPELSRLNFDVIASISHMVNITQTGRTTYEGRAIIEPYCSTSQGVWPTAMTQSFVFPTPKGSGIVYGIFETIFLRNSKVKVEVIDKTYDQGKIIVNLTPTSSLSNFESLEWLLDVIFDSESNNAYVKVSEKGLF